MEVGYFLVLDNPEEFRKHASVENGFPVLTELGKICRQKIKQISQIVIYFASTNLFIFASFAVTCNEYPNYLFVIF